MMKVDEKFRDALSRTHQANIGRYRKLLTTHLTKVEREFVSSRLSQELQLLSELEASKGTPRSAFGDKKRSKNSRPSNQQGPKITGAAS